MEIRPLRERDSDGVARLLGELGYPQPPDLERVRDWVADENAHVLLAEDDGRLAGLVAFSYCRYFAKPGRYVRIASLVVDERHRRDGLGRTLMEAAHDRAREAGCTAAEVTSGRRRDASHPFYKSLGYEDLTERSVRYLLSF
jgi:GNAT superfamily N-acetyltransferase